ncbi:protein FAM171A1 isoform X2 [Canis lupus baileyi]|uniref:Family with sequence similarity 171 member A1 n=2 Tax=Canis lupus familiaris TaxID=9615 RepID=A0A8I3NII3_CANLF|nr:protein FAM171A1 isoform X2 [Canis lupus dingo]XP_038312743.1 protein FAM171A1 isoform X2 [Canis lupus familiaris]XP_038385946.1 protein FAM171A1 isoform X2 [Canis lupus familiaris]XP_038514276.1 protein FAM171A1 isoform X2 [Canis lupus familiaris]
MSRSAALLLCLLGCNVWTAGTKAPREPGAGAQEVTLKVHISDASTHQPVPDALIEIFTNQVSVASGTSGTDGVAFIKFQYKLGSQLIVTATKHAYVPNSAPWKPIRLPVFSSLSLGLLPERSATLMVYEDVVQIVSGFQGARPQPRVHFQRRALRLPENTSYSDLTAFLTAASSPSEVDSFPYLRGLDGNGTGTWLKSGLGLVHQEGSQRTWTYIAPQLGYWVAAMSPPNPGPVVTQDITTYHTVFLLAILGGMAFILLVLLCLLLYYCRRKCLKPRQHHRKLQLPAALESSKRDQSTSMSHINLLFSRRESEFPGPLAVTSHGRPDAPGPKELMSGVHLEMMSSNGEVDMHTPMLKLSYSTSQEFSSREELLSHKEEDKSQISFDNLTPSGTLGKEYHKSVEIFPLKPRKSVEREGCESPGNSEYRRSYNAMLSQPLFEKQDRDAQASVNHIPTGSKLTIQEHMYPAPSSPEKEQLLDRRPTECMMSRSVDHLERPTSFPRPGQLICCSSVDQVNDSVYRKVLPALVIPAHYMKLPGDHTYVGQPLVVPADQQLEIERLQAELSSPHAGIFPHPSSQIQAQPLSCQAISQQHLQDAGTREWTPQGASMSESLSIPASLNDAALAQMNSEVQLLTEKALMELGGGKPLPHPRAWFVSLDGRSNAHVRHSYIDLQRAGRNGSNDASLDSGVDMNEPKSARKGRGDPLSLAQNHPAVQEHPQKEPRAADSASYTQLVYLDDMDQSGSECGTTVCTPEDSALRCLLDGSGRRSGGQLPSLQEETTKRTSDVPPEPLASPEQRRSAQEDDEEEDEEDQGEDKKSPWQKREERPLMAFNIK